MFLNDHKVLDYAVGGWTFNGVSVFQSGFPLQVTDTKNFNSSYGYAVQRPNATASIPRHPEAWNLA